MSKIILEEMEFFAYHGCFKEEQVIGNNFIVHAEIETNTEKAQKSDNLNDTVNYQQIYNIIEKQMDIRSDLLEHLCERIASTVMKTFPVVRHFKVRVRKMYPPMGGKMRSVSVELEKSR